MNRTASDWLVEKSSKYLYKMKDLQAEESRNKEVILAKKKKKKRCGFVIARSLYFRGQQGFIR